MKVKFVLGLLLIIVLGLAGWHYQYYKETQLELDTLGKEKQDLNAQLKDYTEQSIKLNTKIQGLQGDLEAANAKNESLTKELAQTTARLNKSEADAAVAAKNAEEQIAKREAELTQMTNEKTSLMAKMEDLDTQIAALEEQLNDTTGKLNLSEKNREFLVKELKRLQSEKAELERQMNSLDFLTEQVRRLKQETSVSGKLDIMSRGIYGFRRGGERMVLGNNSRRAKNSSTNYNLNVDIHQDGDAEVIKDSE